MKDAHPTQPVSGRKNSRVRTRTFSDAGLKVSIATPGTDTSGEPLSLALPHGTTAAAVESHKAYIAAKKSTHRERILHVWLSSVLRCETGDVALWDSTAARVVPVEKGSAQAQRIHHWCPSLWRPIETLSPGIENVLCGRVILPPRKPLGGVPSFIVHTVDPVNTSKPNSISAYSFSFATTEVPPRATSNDARRDRRAGHSIRHRGGKVATNFDSPRFRNPAGRHRIEPRYPDEALRPRLPPRIVVA